ncbi:propanediol utilization protein [Pararhodobacter marinus]|uniref:Propanediol utilization protein n=1 Tax=Pararhodobacter marinus TaxID=2184063 RepID=A0A2U2CI30_9RHOB|nr:propanediol utilization protein [Pararhodobacter marinus]PWE31540.1 propanediol utilization protein [Pararhodobacter marinus]
MTNAPARAPQKPLHSGAGLRVRGHFGELLQGKLGAEGPLVLVSLPCPALWVELGTGDRSLLGPRRVRALCRALSLPEPDTLPPMQATMPPGGGGGSSTAALVALARWLGFDGAPETLARACVEAEGASDPLMLPRPETCLFASRRGEVVERLPALPRFEVLGGFLGPVQRTRAEDEAFPDIADLVAHWRGGVDLPGLCALTGESARRTLALRGPEGDPTASLADRLGATGWMIAHTGSARGLIFAPGRVPAGAAALLEQAGFTGVLHFAGGGA